MTQTSTLILLGAGGHAKVVLAMARAAGLSVRGVCAPEFRTTGLADWYGVPALGDETVLLEMDPAQVQLINGVGQLPRSCARRIVFEKFKSMGFDFQILIHPNAWVAPDVKLASGVQIMAGAIVQPGCEIGENSVINTGAQVDHDCSISHNVHIAPGAVLCGGVSVGNNAFVGARAVVVQNVQIEEAAFIPACSLITKNSSQPGFEKRKEE